MVDVSVGAFRRRSGSTRTPLAPTEVVLSTAKVPNPDTTSFRIKYNAATTPAGGTPVTGYLVYLNGVQVAAIPATNREPGFGAPAYSIAPGATYVVQVSAVNSYGEGPRSTPLSVTTVGVSTPPDPPVAAPGAVTTGTAVITWGLVEYVKGAPTYEVYKTTDLTTPVATAGAGATSVMVSGLSANTSYSFVVKAVDPTNSAIKSSASNTVTVRTGSGGGGGVTAMQADSVVEAFGINWHTGFNGTYGGDNTVAFAENAIQLACLDLGCRYLRDAMMSSHSAHIRDVSLWAMARGVKFLLLCGSDRSAMTSQAAANAHVDNHLDAIQWAGQTFVNGIAAFEGINEPNNDGDPAWAQKSQWAQTAMWNRTKLRTGVGGTPRLDSIPILGVSMANRPSGGRTQYTDDFTALGDLTSPRVCDKGVIHVYQGGLNPSNRLQTVLAPSRISYPVPTPFWSTEGGTFDSATTTINNQYVPDDVAAKYMPMTLLEHINAGAEKYFMYEGLDDVVTASSTQTQKLQASFGMIATPSLNQNTWTKKAQWYAMKRFLGLMADPGASFSPATLNITVTGGGTGFRWKLYQKRNGKFLLLMWRDVVLYRDHAYVGVADATATVTLGSALPAALHKPSSGQGTALTSSPYSTLTARTSFNVTLGGEVVVAELG